MTLFPDGMNKTPVCSYSWRLCKARQWDLIWQFNPALASFVCNMTQHQESIVQLTQLVSSSVMYEHIYIYTTTKIIMQTQRKAGHNVQTQPSRKRTSFLIYCTSSGTQIVSSVSLPLSYCSFLIFLLSLCSTLSCSFPLCSFL